MITAIIWFASFVMLFMTTFWFSILLFNGIKQEKTNLNILLNYPLVTIAIPCYNEEKKIINTLNSIFLLNYKNIEVIVADDGSKDNTLNLVKNFSKTHSLTIISLNHKGKAHALNKTLEISKGEFFSNVDADSEVQPETLSLLLPHFSDESIAATVPFMQIKNPKKIISKIQKIEYLIAGVIRSLMSSIETLHLTHGVMTVYRTSLLKKLGGFDELTLTDDFEMGMRLIYHGYKIKMEAKAAVFTHPPLTFKALWRQRVRWFRGYISHHIQYSKMFLNQRYGMMGKFQFPINILYPLIIIALTSLTLITLFKTLRIKLMELFSLGFSALNINFLGVKETLLSLDYKLIFPIVVMLILGIYIFYISHILNKEKIKSPFVIFIFFVIYPYIIASHWVSAFINETGNLKKKW